MEVLSYLYIYFLMNKIFKCKKKLGLNMHPNFFLPPFPFWSVYLNNNVALFFILFECALNSHFI